MMTDEKRTKSWYDVTDLELQRVAVTDSFYLRAIMLYANPNLFVRCARYGLTYSYY